MFALGLGVDPFELELVPHQLHEFIDVPTMFGADGTGVGDAVEEIELFDGDGVDLVQGVYDGDVASALGFEDIDQVVNGGVTPDGNVGRIDTVLVHDGFDLVVINVCQRDGAGDVQATFVFFLEDNIGRFLVDADSEAFQLGLDDSLVRQRLVDIENDEDEMACFGNSNDLATSTLAILCSLDDTRQVEHLDGGTIVKNLTGNGGEGGELVGGGLRVLAGQTTHQG